PARAAGQAPAGPPRLGQPDPDRGEDRRVRRGRLVPSGDPGPGGAGPAGRLLLSRRTVATHVSHILKKLDVHSRTDIARESALRTVASRGPPREPPIGRA